MPEAAFIGHVRCQLGGSARVRRWKHARRLHRIARTTSHITPRDYLLDATDWHRVDPPFRPGFEKRYYGYGRQFWLFPGETRRFALLGVYGQLTFVDPQLKLVMVQTTANATAKAGETSLAKEADAFWRGLVRHYGAW